MLIYVPGLQRKERWKDTVKCKNKITCTGKMEYTTGMIKGSLWEEIQSILKL